MRVRDLKTGDVFCIRGGKDVLFLKTYSTWGHMQINDLDEYVDEDKGPCTVVGHIDPYKLNKILLEVFEHEM